MKIRKFSQTVIVEVFHNLTLENVYTYHILFDSTEKYKSDKNEEEASPQR